MIDVQAGAYGLGDLQNLFLKKKIKALRQHFFVSAVNFLTCK